MSGAKTSFLSEIEDLVSEVVRSEGLQLYDLEFVGSGRQRVLRVFIDKQEEGGVSIDDCANVSRGLNVVLDAEDIIPGGAYDLEVSSPGLERRLTQTRHFEAAIGRQVQIRTEDFISIPEEADFKSPPKIKKINGSVVSANESEVILLKDDMNWVIPRNSILKAKIVFEDTKFQPKPKRVKKKKK